MMKVARTTEQMKKYLESRVLKEPGGCWLWQGPVSRTGYGVLAWERPGMTRLMGAHRVAYIAFKGEPSSLYVCHTCDVRNCVNPDHLFLGTPADNSSDMVTKNRQARLKGIDRGTAVLTEDQVREIRRLVAGGMMQKNLASRYGVSRTLISKIVNNKLWTHI